MQHDSRPGEDAAGSITARLRIALREAGHAAAGAQLTLLADKGLAHAHVRVGGTGLLARIPKQSQLDLPPAHGLAYEAACFRAAAGAGCSPLLHAVLPPSDALPRGALLVDEVAGRPAVLPGQLPAMARCLAALHALPVPPAGARGPLLAPADGLAALVNDIAQQAVHLDARRHPEAARAAHSGLATLQSLAARTARPGVRLIAFDAHPGNFLVDAQGRAWLVDLEKCRYAGPGLDLAHATLYTSTTWDPDSSTALRMDEVLDFYSAWEAAVDAPLAAAARGWHGPLRLGMWLWSLTWCAKWQALSQREPDASLQGEDWSAAQSDAALVAHVRERVAHYLEARTVAQVQSELAALEQAWRA